MLVLLSVLATLLAPGLGHVFEMPTVVPTNETDIWAVLVAGSNGWMNYRHQADVCHAYQILHAHGIPDDHIIVMMMDDIANNTMNPHNGTIINRPGGPDVYHGVPKDYVGAAVTPENFLQIITGNGTGLDKVGSGKVLKSTNTSHVFINLVDHGAPGIFGFPFHHTPPKPGHHPPPKLPVLKARDFIGAIEKMNKTSMYKEMVIYLESCESGSMFQKILPKDINVFAVTASNAKESSWGCYFNKTMKTALGDVFSVKWMEDTDREDVTKETLHKQLWKVKKEVKTSHVMHYGNSNISAEFLSVFMGNKTTNLEESWGPFPPHHDPCLKTAYVSSDIPLASLNASLEEAEASNNQDEYDYWQHQIDNFHRNRKWMEAVFMNIVKHQLQYGISEIVSDEDFDINNWDCYEANLQVLNDECFDISANTYALTQLQTLVNMCELGYDTNSFTRAALSVCVHPPVFGII